MPYQQINTIPVWFTYIRFSILSEINAKNLRSKIRQYMDSTRSKIRQYMSYLRSKIRQYMSYLRSKIRLYMDSTRSLCPEEPLELVRQSFSDSSDSSRHSKLPLQMLRESMHCPLLQVHWLLSHDALSDVKVYHCVCVCVCVCACVYACVCVCSVFVYASASEFRRTHRITMI